MGFYDRDYNRDEGGEYGSGVHLGGHWSAGEWALSTRLVVFMFGVYAVQIVTRIPPVSVGWFTDLFSLHADMPRHPWTAFELLTYGFLHDPYDLKHICFNMLGLWMFGRSVEQRTGRQEFLAFFLVAVVFSGSVWFVAELVSQGGMSPQQLMGASGGLAAVLILFALCFPQQKVYIYGVFPLPAWIFAIFFVGMDLMGAIERAGNIAYTAHLGGAFFAVVYFLRRWQLCDVLPGKLRLPGWKRRPSLRIHDPEAEIEKQVDAILQKIQQQGQSSLTRQERRILERASRQYQQRRK